MQPTSNTTVISRPELRWVLLATAIVVGLTLLPYIFATVAAPPGLVFGGVLINPQDGNSYLAKMYQGYEGAWLYRLAYSPENEPGWLVYSLYLILGHLARVTGLPIVWVYHAGRVAAGVLLLVGVYRFAAVLTPDVQARRWAWTIAAFGSGLGVLTQLSGRAIVGYLPIDFYFPQSNIFYSLLTNPHFPLTTAFEIWLVLWLIEPPFTQWPESLNLIAIAGLGLGIISMAPYLISVMGLVAGVGLIGVRPFNSKILVRLGVLGAAMGSLALFNLWQLTHNLTMTTWLDQIGTVSPPLPDTLLGFGVWLSLALSGAWVIRKANQQASRPFIAVLLAWIVFGVAGMYSPVVLSGRLLGGIFAPIAILAGLGLHWLLNLVSGIRQKLIFLAIVGLGFNTNALILAATFTAPRQALDTMYLTVDEMAAFQWLAPRVTMNDVVLADPRLGNFVPAWTGSRVVYGHNLETANAAVKWTEVTNYYRSSPDLDLLSRYKVKYVIGGQKPAGWKIVYQNETLTIYGR